MPKSRNKNNSSKNAAHTPAVPLLDSIRAQIQPLIKSKNELELKTDDSKVSTAGWQCDIDDWSDKKVANNQPDKFPQTARSIERKHEQTKNIFFSLSKTIIDENENKSEITEEINNQTTRILTDTIDLPKLTLIVTDLITGKRDESAYADFLSILKRFSVLSTRDDHLEETVYHLIQAAVSFIRSNQYRFDPLKLEECYRQRSVLKATSTQ